MEGGKQKYLKYNEEELLTNQSIHTIYQALGWKVEQINNNAGKKRAQQNAKVSG